MRQFRDAARIIEKIRSKSYLKDYIDDIDVTEVAQRLRLRCTVLERSLQSVTLELERRKYADSWIKKYHPSVWEKLKPWVEKH